MRRQRSPRARVPFRPDTGPSCLSHPQGRVATYKYLTKEGGFVRWQFGADNVLSIKNKETELLVLDDWSGDYTTQES